MLWLCPVSSLVDGLGHFRPQNYVTCMSAASRGDTASTVGFLQTIVSSSCFLSGPVPLDLLPGVASTFSQPLAPRVSLYSLELSDSGDSWSWGVCHSLGGWVSVQLL